MSRTPDEQFETPDEQFPEYRQLQARVDRWLDDVVIDHPGIAAHRVEIADHLVHDGERRLSAGEGNVEQVFIAALAALGPSELLAAEFDKRHNLVAKCRRLVSADRVPTKREQSLLAGAWIIMSLCWAAAMTFLGPNINWMLFGWTVTTFLPLTALGAAMDRSTNGRKRRRA